MILFDVLVGVPLKVARPAAGDDHDKAHAFLDEPPRQQTAPAIVVGRLRADAVEVECLLASRRAMSNTCGASVCMRNANS